MRLTYANVVSTLAVFVALGGGAQAAVTLKRNSVKAETIASGAVVSAKVRDGSLVVADLGARPVPGERGAAGPSGAVGPVGAAGPAGVRGAAGLPGPAGAKGDPGAAGPSGLGMASVGATSSPMQLFSYTIDTSTFGSYDFGGWNHLETFGVSGQVRACTAIGSRYVAYWDNGRSIGTTNPTSDCTPNFNVGAGGDFKIRFDEVVMIGVPRGNGVFAVYGFGERD